MEGHLGVLLDGVQKGELFLVPVLCVVIHHHLKTLAIAIVYRHRNSTVFRSLSELGLEEVLVHFSITSSFHDRRETSTVGGRLRLGFWGVSQASLPAKQSLARAPMYA